MADYAYPYLNSVPKMTVGVGRDFASMGLTEAEGIAIMRADIIRIRTMLRKRLTWFDEMSYPRQDALTNMVFRIGIEATMTKMADVVNHMRYNRNGEAAAMIRNGSRWFLDDEPRAEHTATIIETNVFDVV